MSLIQNAPVTPKYRVTFHVNRGAAGPGNPMVTGDDWAWSLSEAYALAEVRIQCCGLPGQSYVWEGEKCLRKYWVDFDARSHYIDNPPEAPK